MPSVGASCRRISISDAAQRRSNLVQTYPWQGLGMLLSQLACNREKNKSKLDLGPLGGKRDRNVDLRMWSKESANHSTETENIRSCLTCISLTKCMV